MARNIAVAANLHSPSGTAYRWVMHGWNLHWPTNKQDLLPVLKLRVYTETTTILFYYLPQWHPKPKKKQPNSNKYWILYS